MTVPKIGDFNQACCYGVVFGGIGYLGARMFEYMDPRVAAICTATAGAATALFLNKRSHPLAKITGLAIIIFAPYKICEALNYPFPMQTCAAITVLTTACALYIKHRQQQSAYKRFLSTLSAD